MKLFEQELETVRQTTSPAIIGRVEDVTGLTIRVRDFPASVGSMCRIVSRDGAEVSAQLVGFAGDVALLMPLGDLQGLARGDEVMMCPGGARVGVSRRLLGRVLNGLGEVIDDGPAIHPDAYYPLLRAAPEALQRPRITTPIGTGIRAMDGLVTAGCGQRLGLFSGTGVGKSVLLGMIARYTSADVTVAAFVGERGREVNDFLAKDLGEEGRKKTVLVIATSDESPVLRVRASFVATAVAEYFRDCGNNVLLLMDSLTRLAMAQRQIGLAAGEPPATKGYTPSVFGMLPQLLERAGRTEVGSITGFYTVLVEGDDLSEPISDAVRGILDGHVSLSRRLANRGHYPAVDVLESISRLMDDVVDENLLAAARVVRGVLAVYAEIEDLVNIGAYAPGTSQHYDVAIEAKPLVDAFLQQRIEERVEMAEVRSSLATLGAEIGKLEEKWRKSGVRRSPNVAAAPAPA